MDAEGGPIQTTKTNLGPILAQQFFNKGTLSKADLVYCFHLAYVGGSYEVMAGATRTVTGVTTEVILKAMNKVGWWEEGGKLVYKPMDVIDPRKFVKHHARFTNKGRSLGPIEAEPKWEVGRTRNADSFRFYNIEDAQISHSQTLALEALSTALPAIVPQSNKKTKLRKKQYPDGCLLTMDMHTQAEADRVAKEAAAANKKQKTEADKAEAVTRAAAACKGTLSMLMANVDTVDEVKGETLTNVLRTMSLTIGGTADERRQRVRDNMPEFKEAHEAVQAPASQPVVVVGVVVNPLQPVVAAVVKAAAGPFPRGFLDDDDDDEVNAGY